MSSKNQLMVNSRGLIIHKTANKKGRRHDYYIYNKNNHSAILKQVVTVVDLGYQGMEKDYSDQLSTFPCKKRNQEEL
jgi:hypothetical protein